MTMITSRARPTKTTRAPVITLLLRYCARRPSRTARPTAMAERPKKKTKKAPGVKASDASSASPSSSHNHHDIGRGVYSPPAPGSSREQPNILGPAQHAQQEDEPRDPEQVCPDRGGRHQQVEASGEREDHGEDVPVAR